VLPSRQPSGRRKRGEVYLFPLTPDEKKRKTVEFLPLRRGEKKNILRPISMNGKKRSRERRTFVLLDA